MGDVITKLPDADTLEAIRGHEGNGASIYFGVLRYGLRQQVEDFAFSARTRRPPKDAFNCLLSFLYALAMHDCVAALTAAGLDPFVGFLHSERPGRPSLALDLLEEFRPLLGDRMALTLVNRREVTLADFTEREGGAFELTEQGRKTVVKAYQQRKRESLTHPLLGHQCSVGRLPFLQARLLARYLRRDIPDYPPCVPR